MKDFLNLDSSMKDDGLFCLFAVPLHSNRPDQLQWSKYHNRYTDLLIIDYLEVQVRCLVTWFGVVGWHKCSLWGLWLTRFQELTTRSHDPDSDSPPLAFVASCLWPWWSFCWCLKPFCFIRRRTRSVFTHENLHLLTVKGERRDFRLFQDPNSQEKIT